MATEDRKHQKAPRAISSWS